MKGRKGATFALTQLQGSGTPKHEPEIVGPAPLRQGGALSEACPPAMKFIIHNWLVRPPGLNEEFVTRRLEAALDGIRGERWHPSETNE